MVIRWAFPRGSGIDLKPAVAPPIAVVLISAFELIRRVKVEPEPRPTFRTETDALARSERSAPGLPTVISKPVTCHTALASSCACDSEQQLIVKNRINAIVFIRRLTGLCDERFRVFKR